MAYPPFSHGAAFYEALPTPPYQPLHRNYGYSYAPANAAAAAYGAAQQRPATRAHVRMGSSGDYLGGPRTPVSPSPRYDSAGRYATVDFNVSASRSTRKQSSSGPSGLSGYRSRDRRNSYSYHRVPDSQGESDEDEFIEVDGRTYVLHPSSRSARRHVTTEYVPVPHGGHGTDRARFSQGARYTMPKSPGYTHVYKQADFSSSPAQTPTPTRSRRDSVPVRDVPPRPQTTRPGCVPGKKSGAAPYRAATVDDMRRWKIPTGYSVKNWDASEDPFLLLGSVFDGNALGKWIYDWTVHAIGPSTPLADVAGDLWLLIIKLTGSLKHAEGAGPRVRSQRNREAVAEFLESGLRLTGRLQRLIRACEAPMLIPARDEKNQLAKDAGVRFVKTLFGRDRQLEETEELMAGIRLWLMRFETNCIPILEKPTE